MKHRIFNPAAMAVFVFFLFVIAFGTVNAADSEQNNNWAAGFVSGQEYRIEFRGNDSSQFLACDEEGELYLTEDASDENSIWKASASFGHDFKLTANGFTLKWQKEDDSDMPVLIADNIRKTIDDMAKKPEGSGDNENEKPSSGSEPSSIEVGNAGPPKPPSDGPGDSGKSSEWTYHYNNGKGSLSGALNDDVWYVTIDGSNKPGSTQDSAAAADIKLRTEGRAGGDIIKGAPSTVAPFVKGDMRPYAPKFTVTTQNIPEGTAPDYVWTIDGEEYSTEKDLLIIDPNRLSVGVHEIQCGISFVDAYGTAFDQLSWVTNFIVCNGIIENSLITFSDVHETFENVGKAIADIMTENHGKIPALVVCTGDWTNTHPNADTETVKAYHLPMLKAQIGGIDTVFVAGNHETAESANDANAEANLGYDGSGVIFTSQPGRQGTSSRNMGLYVYGINFDEVTVTSNGKKSYSYQNVYQKLESFLNSLAAHYHDELILISSHTGLHVLGVLEQSNSKEWDGSNTYNVDMSADIVALLNEYAKNYGMRFIFLFGHDHSRNETEFTLNPGDTIVSTKTYADKDYEEQTLAFTYGHAGYLTNSINGNEHFTFLTWNRDSLNRNLRKIGEVTQTTEPNPESDPNPEPLYLYRIAEFSWLDHLPATGFSASKYTDLALRPQELSYDETGFTLQIPELDVDEPILIVPMQNGSYPVEWLGSAVGLLEQSDLPGEGISILTGHNHLNSMEAGPFLFLSTIDEGDRILISKEGTDLRFYTVYGNYKITADGFASIAGDLRDNSLVLITCEDESVEGGYLNRRVIFAEPL